jgi:hypothetical protein
LVAHRGSPWSTDYGLSCRALQQKSVAGAIK